MAGQGPKGHADTTVLRRATTPSIALAGMLADDVTVHRGTTRKGSAAALIATCKFNAGPHTTQQQKMAMRLG